MSTATYTGRLAKADHYRLHGLAQITLVLDGPEGRVTALWAFGSSEAAWHACRAARATLHEGEQYRVTGTKLAHTGGLQYLLGASAATLIPATESTLT